MESYCRVEIWPAESHRFTRRARRWWEDWPMGNWKTPERKNPTFQHRAFTFRSLKFGNYILYYPTYYFWSFSAPN